MSIFCSIFSSCQKQKFEKTKKDVFCHYKYQFYICQSLFLQKIKKIEEETHFFFNFENDDPGHPIWFCPKVCIFFIFYTQRPFQNDIMLVFVKKKFMSNFWHKTCFFQKSVFWQKNFLGQMSLFMVLERFKLRYVFFWAKSGCQIFFDVPFFRVVTIWILI
jgi:hypothetical protein